MSFLLHPNGHGNLGATYPMLRALRVLALGYDCRALRALAADAAYRKQPLENRAFAKLPSCAIGATPYLGLIPPHTPRPATLTLLTREPDVKRKNTDSKKIVKRYKFL